jgi:hypothetical protein
MSLYVKDPTRWTLYPPYTSAVTNTEYIFTKLRITIARPESGYPTVSQSYNLVDFDSILYHKSTTCLYFYKYSICVGSFQFDLDHLIKMELI